jgi:hydrophobe/amphiphile efflux-1 (HAE1) family protein
MNISAIAIKRPVFTVMVTLALLVLGGVGLSRLGTDLFPDVSFPVVSVNIVYPGASPAEVESQVTKPLEDALVSLNGIDRLRTFSRESLSTTVILFKLGVDVEEAANQVRERVAQSRFKLPVEVKEPAISRLDVSAAPILTYTLRGKRSLSELRKYADDVIRPAIEQVDGVAAGNIKGGAPREIQVRLNRARLDALGITAGDVVQVLRANSLNVPAGHFDEGAREISVRAVGELAAVSAVRDVVVSAGRDGSSVRLSDLGDVIDGFEEAHTRVRANGDEAVSLEILKQSGRNTVEVADGVMAKMKTMSATFPDGIQAALIIDQSQYIRENAHEVEIAIVFGGAMAILIILVFMLDLRSTIISALALPTSVIATFFLMYVLGFTLNMMTLLGLSLAIGLLIDDAVVVRENIFKHLERGESPRDAALHGTQEIALSVLATTLTIVAVFVPVAFMSGMVGQFFRQFGLTVSAAVLVSLFVAFTLDPMLSSRFSKTIVHGGDSPIIKGIKAPFLFVFKGMDDAYHALLYWALRHKLIVGGLAIASLFGTMQITKLMGSDFVNPEDRGQMVVDVELPAGTSLEETSKKLYTAEKKLLEDPLIITVFATLGPDGDSNKAHVRVVAVPKQQRKIGILALKDRVRSTFQAIPNADVVITDPPFIEGAATETPIQIFVRGDKYEDILPTARKIASTLNGTAGVTDVQVKYSPGRPELRVVVDRQRAADQGLMVGQIAMAMRTSMEGEEAAKLRDGKDEVPIRVRLREEDRASALDLGRISLRSPKGTIALSDIATLDRGEGPQVIEREARRRQIAIWATPKGRALGDIVADAKPTIDKLQLPAGVSLAYEGQIRQMNESNSSMGLALLLGVVFIYLVLASQFESFIHPLTIMMTLPLAMVGAVIGLFVSKNTVAIGSLIGIILLMGLVTKNAILLVDRAIVRVREHGDKPFDAILAAGPERLRPILMTSAAMVLGMLPTAISNANGSEFRAPMAIAVIGGVISSTLLSLVVIPVLYLSIENAKGHLSRWFGLAPKPQAPPPEAAE